MAEQVHAHRMPLKHRVAGIAGDFASVVRRFPLAVIASFVAFACCLALLEKPAKPLEVELLRVIFVCTLALPLTFALALLREQSTRRGIARHALEALGLVLLVAYGMWWQIQPEEVPFKHYVCHALLLLIAHLFVACAPFLKRADDDGFWHYNKTLFLRYLLGALYSVVLFAGLALALLSVDRLLTLKIDGENYGRLFFAIATVFHPLFFLAGIPKNFTRSAREFPAALRRFVQFCLMPLVVIYLTILYLYTAKIVFSWELPNGWVALPVLILAVLGILSALLLDPLRNSREFAWPEIYTRWFYRLLLPLTGLLMISIGVRIADYGVTENRYFVALLAGWLLVIALAYGFLRTRSTRWIPLSLGVICLFSAWGPWSASAVSFRSQRTMLMQDFTQLEVLSNGRLVVKAQTIPAGTYNGIKSRLNYLFRQHDSHLLDAMMAGYPKWAKDAAAGYTRRNSNDRADGLLRTLQINPETEDSSSYSLKSPAPFQVKADGIVSYHNSQTRWRSATGELLPNSTLTLSFDAACRITLETNNQKVAVSWDEAVVALPHGGDQTNIPHNKLTQTVLIDQYQVELSATEINISQANRKLRIKSISLIAIVYPREN